MTNFYKILAGGALFAGIISQSQAATISWGGAHFTSNYSSDGTALGIGATDTSPSGTVMFELGIFQDPTTGAAFTPSLSNADQWAANWVRFDPVAGSDPSSTPGVSEYSTPVAAGDADVLGENYFGDTVELGTETNKVETFAEQMPFMNQQLTIGRQVYIWGFDQQSYVPGSGDFPEWLLFTGATASDGATPTNQNWLVPDHEIAGNDSFTLVWDVNTATEAVFGQIPGSTGEGELDPVTLEGPEDIQFASLVPEPSAALLLLLGSLGLLGRRQR